MKKKTTWICVAFLANLVLLPFAMAPEGRAQARGDPLFYHCCKKTSLGKRYCCERCCVLIWNCVTHEKCQKP